MTESDLFIALCTLSTKYFRLCSGNNFVLYTVICTLPVPIDYYSANIDCRKLVIWAKIFLVKNNFSLKYLHCSKIALQGVKEKQFVHV